MCEYPLAINEYYILINILKDIKHSKLRATDKITLSECAGFKTNFTRFVVGYNNGYKRNL